MIFPLSRLSWLEYFMLDVLFFYFGIVAFVVYVVVAAIKFCFRKIVPHKQKTE